MTPQERLKTLIELKIAKIGERIMNDIETDWDETYSKMDFRPDEIEKLAEKYVNNSLLQELYLQSSKSLLK